MRIFVAVVHAIGEDNEGNVSLVAKTREELDAKLLAFYQESAWDADEFPEEAEREKQTTLEDYYGKYDWNVDEHEV